MNDWMYAQQQALLEHVPGSIDCLQEVLDRGLDVTTHYSGTGAAEIATEKVFGSRVRFHSACDISPICQCVLLKHGPECAAEHVYKDLLADLPGTSWTT